MAKVIAAGRSPGIYQVCTNANEDYAIAIPAYARGAVIWFETSASVTTRVGGRVTYNGSSTKIPSVANTDAKMAYVPDIPVQIDIPRQAQQGVDSALTNLTHLHVASPTAGAVVRGFWTWDA